MPKPPVPPKGNKYAVGNKGGCPPTYDLNEEAKAIEEWAKKPSSIHLAQFALERGTYAGRLYEWRDASPVFATSLRVARSNLAIRLREKINNPNEHYNEKLFHRDISCHDELLRLDERDEKVFDSELKKQELDKKAKSDAEHLRDVAILCGHQPQEISRAEESIQPNVEAQQPLLHKKPKGRKGKVQS